MNIALGMLKFSEQFVIIITNTVCWRIPWILMKNMKGGAWNGIRL